MCGIVAHLSFREKTRISESTLDVLTETLFHRGPDSKGMFLSDDVALGIRRLSIIDLQGGQQPIVSRDGRYVIVFNGEIYNHQELRQKLITKGYSFKTRCDTEVLLIAFIDRGSACLAELNGMFAFAIWDQKEKSLFVARDRLGIKPLYYATNSDRVMFASELTPLMQSGFFDLQWNTQAISDYLAYWYICEPKTIFDNIHQLSPGTFAVIRDGQMTTTSYWSIPTAPESERDFGRTMVQLQELLEDSIKLRMKVDVPIGTFLSGGIDSGLITNIAASHSPERLQSFSIGFKEQSYSELSLAQETAKRSHATLVCTQLDDLKPEHLDDIFAAFDEPLGNASFVPTYFLAKKASEYVKVVLTGDGADELFGGYPTYQAPYFQTLYARAPALFKTAFQNVIPRLPVSHKRISLDYRLKQLVKGLSLDYRRAHFTWREVTSGATQRALFRPSVSEHLASYDPFSVAQSYFEIAKTLDIQHQLMFVDMNTYLLNDHLRKVDRMTMAHSLEARVPFLDHRIVELSMRMPSAFKVSFFRTKKILRTLASPMLPKKVVHGKKKGLTSPIAGWISEDLADYVQDELREQGGPFEELFQPKTIQGLLDQHRKKEKDNSRILWGLLTLKGWGKQLRQGVATQRRFDW